MLSFDRRKFLALGLGGLTTACGFTPAYGPNSGASALRNSVEISTPNSQDGFILRSQLQDNLGMASAAKYRLDASVSISTSTVGVTEQLSISRYHVTGTANYTLTELSTGAVVTSGSVPGFTSYSATSSTVDAITVPEATRRRLVTLLADKVALKVLAAAS